MIRTSILLRNILLPNINNCVKCSSQQLVSNSDVQNKLSKKSQFRNSSPFQEVENAANLEIPTMTQPAFNFSAYINKSKTLQELLKLGVDLYQLEKRKGVPQYILKLDFERDIKDHLLFLHDMNVPADALGELITTNPLIFKEAIGNLMLRVCYLESKNFTTSQITRVIVQNPFWLMFTTKRIDKRLGFFQNNFALKGDDIRFLATKQPNLITYNLEHIRTNTFSIKEEMGFDEDEMRCLILNKPRLWMMNREDLLERYDYIQQQMNLTNEQILEFPNILTTRLWRIKQRHEFLKFLGRANYDCHKDLFVSPKKLVEGPDLDFVLNVAKSSLDNYNNFLKTM